ncbi:MAG: translocation/assembly module TamB domain-containing protein, partial [Pseudomonadota bacterium]
MRWAMIGLMLLALLPQGAMGQDDDEGRLVRFIEDALSDGAARSIDLQGFRGALSSRASLDRLTVADAGGVWLEIEGAELDWNRAAILTGRLQINALTAETVTLHRLPEAEPTAPSPEATTFALPDLPVSIDVDLAEIGRLEIGETVLGSAIVATATAEVRLAAGAGSAVVSLERTDGEIGILAFEGSYDNATGAAAIALSAEEGPGGIAVDLLGIAGAPAIALNVDGAGPPDGFAATFALATDGAERLSGTVESGRRDDGAVTYALDIAGDLTPILSADAAEFLGTDAQIIGRATREPDGALSLDGLQIRAAAVTLDGQLRLDAAGQPTAFALTGTLTPPGNANRLTLPGGVAELAGATLNLSYDAAAVDAVTGLVAMDGLTANGLSAPEAELVLDGTIARSGTEITGFDGAVELSVLGVAHTDPGIAAALGPEISVSAVAGWDAGGAYTLRDLSARTVGSQLSGDIAVAPGDARLDISAALTLTARDLRAFAGLAGIDISGAAEASAQIEAEALSGAFDVTLDAVTEDLGLAGVVPEGLLAGRTSLSGGVVRDEAGITLRGFEIAGTALSLTADGQVSTDTADLTLDAQLSDAGLADPRFAGPVRFAGRVSRDGPDAPYVLPDFTLETGYGDVGGALSAQIGEDVLAVTADVTADLTDLSAIGTLAGRDMSGAAALSVSGTADIQALEFDVDLDGTLRDLRVPGVVEDALFAGTTDISGGVAGSMDEIAFRALRVDGTALDAALDGTLSRRGATGLVLEASLTDAAAADARLSGPVALSVNVDRASDAQPFVATDLALETRMGALGGTASIHPEAPGIPVTADLALDLPDLSALSDLAGIPISGAVSGTAEGRATLGDGGFAARFDLTTTDVAAGDALPAALLAGETRAVGQIARDGDVISVSDLTIDGRELDVEASGTIGPSDSQAMFSLRLRDAGLLNPAIPGAVTVTADLSQSGTGPYAVTARADGAGGLGAAVQGTVEIAPALALDLDVTGAALLALANRFIAPRSLLGTAQFDLSIDGAPELEAVSGRVTVAGARLGVPAQNLALEGISLRADIAGGAANLDLAAAISSGGRVGATGRVGFGQPGLPADLAISIDDAVLVDPALYEANIAEARLSLTGALAGSSRLSGRIDLGEVEIRVPEGSIGGPGALPDIRHLGETPAERQTRAFAGLLGTNGDGGGSSRVGLDLTISAPGRVFVRGRGLDAELGGLLRIGGTTANVVPSGQFDLLRGRLSILGQRLDLVEGGATLRGGDPFLSLTAIADADPYVIAITIEGLASAPDVSFSSTPDLPEDEVLAQLFFGRTIGTLSAVQALQLADAVASLAGGGSGVFTALREGLGLDDLDIQTDAEGNAVVSAGRYLSENIYTDVTVDNEGT